MSTNPATNELVFDQEAADSGQRLGRTLMQRMALTLKLATMHQLGNDAMRGPIASILETVNPVIGNGEPMLLQAIGENFFLNRDLIKLDFSSFESAQTLRSILKRLGIHEIAFTGALNEADVRQFLAVFQTYFLSKEPKKIAAERLEKIRVRVIDKAEQDAIGGTIDERQNLLRNYAVVSLAVQEAARHLRAGKPARLAKLRRALHGLADAAVGHESLLVGITRFPTLRGQAHYHLTAVASLVILMGRRLGLSRPVLSDLAMAALFHDVSRAELPDPLEGGGLDVEKLAAEASKVPLRSLLRVASGGINADILGTMAVAQEMTLRADGPDSPSAAARLVAVACAFDLMTSASPPRLPLSPDHAMRIILDNAPGRFDPLAARLLLATVGLYPVGTTVLLSTGETALVLEVASDSALFDRPIVKVVRGPDGPVDYVVDLSEPGSPVTIMGAVDPIEEQVDVPQLLLA